jgi:MFS transporter, AAHS family, 4-hydroxybenzoate transporter
LSGVATDTRVGPQAAEAYKGMGRLQFQVGALCFLAILLDGIDTSAIGVVVPTLAKTWAVPPASFTLSFLATNLGAVIGYVGCGPVADRIGRRPLIIVSVLWFGVWSLLTVFADSTTTLWVLRFITALGLGGTVTTALAHAADFAPVRYREAMTIAAGTGLAMGAMLSGLLGAWLIQSFSWRAVFVVGGVLPLLLTPALWLWLPETPGFRRPAPGAPARTKPWSGLARLVSTEFAARTAFLWAFSFLIFTTNYALVSWIPTLLLSFGFSPGQAPVGVAALGFGGVVGNLILMTLAPRFGARRVLVVAGILAIAAILCIAWADLPGSVLLLALAAIGAGLVASSVGQAALAVSIYPQALRTTGVGCSSALGRFGSIVGPAFGGLMLALNWPAREIVQSACLPVLAAIAILFVLSRLVRASGAPATSH